MRNNFFLKINSAVVLSLLLSMMSCTNHKQTIRENLNLGVKASYAGKWSIAIKHFDTVLDMDSTNTEAYLDLAKVYIGKRQYTKAMSFLNKAINIDPKYGDAYLSRARLYTIIGNKEAACKDYLKAQANGVENLYNYTKFCK